MSTEVTKWDEELAKFAQEAASVERPTVANISLRGGVMTYMDQKIPGNKLPCIIIASVMENRYFSKKFDPNKPDAPDCFAFSDTGEDMVPHELVFDRQHETCTGCPQMEWGSAVNSPSGRGKACKETRKIAVLPSSVLKEPGKIDQAEMAMISIPVMSVKNWSNYVNNLSTTLQRPSWAVVTEVSVEPDPKSQFKVLFKYLEPIGDDFLSALSRRRIGAHAALTVPYEKTAEGLSPTTEKLVKNKKY